MEDKITAGQESTPMERRSFLRLAVLGGGAMLWTAALPRREARAAEADALLLSCMDFRLVDETERYISGRGLKNKYDHVILAGASIGALTDKFPAWNKTFWEHLEVAIQLHKIHKVIVLDHRDCGAYKVILGEDFAKDARKETEIHSTKLRELRKLVTEKYPKLEVELLLMDLKGKVQKVA